MSISGLLQLKLSSIGRSLVNMRVGLYFLFAFAIAWIEVRELDAYSQIIAIHVIELIVSFGLLAALVCLAEYLLEQSEIHRQTALSLERKQMINQQLAASHTSDELTVVILTNLAQIARPTDAQLYTYNPHCFDLELLAEWRSGSVTRRPPQDFCIHDSLAERLPTCQACARANSNRLHLLNECRAQLASSDTTAYCLPFSYSDDFIGMLHFRLPKGQALTPKEIEILDLAGSAEAAALSNARQRQWLIEAKMVEAALAERTVVSRDLHDTISQNLGYLHLVLDQALAQSPGSSPDTPIVCTRGEVEKMYTASNEAYEMVRATLKTLRAKSIGLSGLVRERVSSLPGVDNALFQIVEEGRARPLPAATLSQLTLACMGAVQNALLHARARTITVHVNWLPAMLHVQVCDDGCGFDPDQIDTSQHFGIEVMRERIHSAGGSFDLQTAPGQGVIVSFYLPLQNNS